MRERAWCAATVLLLSCLLATVAVGATPGAANTPLAAEIEALEHSTLDPPAFEALLARVRASGDAALEAKAHMLRCHGLVGLDPAQARAAADAGIPVATRAGADEALGGLLACRGYLNDSEGRSNEALVDLDAAVAASRRAGDGPGMAQGLVLRGEIRHARGDYSDALQDLQAAYREYVALENERQQSYTLNAIANLYADARVGQYAQALDYYRQLLAAHEAAGRRGEAATAHFNIASTLERTGDLAAAQAAFARALAGFEAEGDAESVAGAQRAMAGLLMRSGRAAEALPLVEKAVSHARSAGLAQDLARARLTRGGALRRLDRLDEARADLQAARGHFEAHDNPRFLEHIAGELAELEAAAGDWAAAYRERSAQLVLGQRLSQQLDEELSSRLRVQFDSERQEQENAALQREAGLRAAALRDAERIRRLQTAVIALGALLLLGLAWRAWFSARRARQMRVLALTDELTGLPNRRAILQQLAAALDRQPRAAVPVLMFDIDHFKAINDRLGHDTGDQVLRAVATAARRALAGRGEVGRIGGEEFLVLPGPGEAPRLAALAEELRLAVSALVALPADARVSISLGGCLARPGETRPEHVLKRADLALYQAKENGRDRSVILPD